MSEIYEGVVVRGDPSEIRRAFDGLHASSMFRLVRLTETVFGIFRVAGRDTPPDPTALMAWADVFAARLGAALAVVYDGRIGLRCAALVDARGTREFGEADERWAAVGADGM